MIVYKKEYENVVTFVRGYGQINTAEVAPETVAKLATLEQFKNLSKLIEGAKDKTTSK
jgi:hypothetical protein